MTSDPIRHSLRTVLSYAAAVISVSTDRHILVRVCYEIHPNTLLLFRCYGKQLVWRILAGNPRQLTVYACARLLLYTSDRVFRHKSRIHAQRDCLCGVGAGYQLVERQTEADK